MVFHTHKLTYPIAIKSVSTAAYHGGILLTTVATLIIRLLRDTSHWMHLGVFRKVSMGMLYRAV